MARKRNFIKQTEGATAIVIALSLTALIGMASLAIDMGQLYVVRNELQNVADAAALAGAGQLYRKDATTNNAVLDIDLAKATALKVAQTQSEFQRPAVADGERDDLTILAGTWDIYNANPSLAWAEGGSNPNAIFVKIKRGAGTVFGPVSNLFAQIFGASTSDISASATAYLAYTQGVQTGGIQVPLALPITGEYSPLASNGRAGWFASLLGPNEALAITKTLPKIRDTAGSNVNTAVNNSPTLDSNQPYWFTVNSGDAVPGTIKDILTKIYTPSYTSSNPVRVGDLKVGQEINARSEFKYGNAYIAPIFQKLKYAYNYKTTGNKDTAPAPGTAWRTTLVVYGMPSTASQPRKEGLMSLARLLAPFWPSEAFACYTVPPPKAIVKGFVNADITGVTYNASADEGNYTFPKTISTPLPASGSTTYANKKDFLERFPNSVWNLNTVTIKNVTDISTVSPPGSLPGGPPANTINPAAPANVGSLATDRPLLVK